MKAFFGPTWTVIAVFCLVLSLNISCSVAQPGTQVRGTISQDTTWTKADGPYMLTDSVGVSQGTTLTIEPGVTVYLYSYYIMVNGTLQAKGSTSDPVHFKGGWGGPGPVALTFEPTSTSFNRQTGEGCIIENAILNETNVSVENASIKINNNTFSYSPIQIYGTSSQISNNNFTNCGVSMTASIYSPTFASPLIVNNTFSNGQIGFGGGTPSSHPSIIKNTIQGGGIGGNGYAIIADNTISNCLYGLSLNTVVVFGGSEPAYPTVEHNLITQNAYGIQINLFSRYEPGTLVPQITNNTISRNTVAIYITESQYAKAPTIQYNNFQENTHNIYLDQSTPNNINATYNYWGTTNPELINMTMHDSKDNSTLGTVQFTPFLTTPNPQALPNQSAHPSSPSPTTSPIQTTTNPTPTPTVPELQTRTIAVLIAATAISAAIIAKNKKRVR